MCINLSLSLSLSISPSRAYYVHGVQERKVVRRHAESYGCYVAQSSETSAANIIDCTREREDTRERERGGKREGSQGERERESLARAIQCAGRRRDQVGGTPRLMYFLCTPLVALPLSLSFSLSLFVPRDSRLKTDSVNARIFPPAGINTLQIPCKYSCFPFYLSICIAIYFSLSFPPSPCLIDTRSIDRVPGAQNSDMITA